MCRADSTCSLAAVLLKWRSLGWWRRAQASESASSRPRHAAGVVATWQNRWDRACDEAIVSQADLLCGEFLGQVLDWTFVASLEAGLPRLSGVTRGSALGVSFVAFDSPARPQAAPSGACAPQAKAIITTTISRISEELIMTFMILVIVSIFNDNNSNEKKENNTDKT